MRLPGRHELPEELKPVHDRAVRLERVTIAYLVSAIALVYLVLGSSQAMKAVWLEDILTLFPATAFLIATRFRRRPATEAMPFGYHRSVSVAYVIGATAILVLGGYVVIDSVLKLVAAEHASIGVMEIGDWQVWQGWPMLAVLVYTAVPAAILGHLKKPLGARLHDKVLHADAEMMRADWMTATAGAIGVVGIGFGLWWLDATAATAIGLSIVKDGWRYVSNAVGDLMDARPDTYDEKEPHPIKAKVEQAIGGWEWVHEGVARLRENGHVLAGQVLVVPAVDSGIVDLVEEAIDELRALDWKLEDVVVVPVREITHLPEGETLVQGGAGRRRA